MAAFFLLVNSSTFLSSVVKPGKGKQTMPLVYRRTIKSENAMDGNRLLFAAVSMTLVQVFLLVIEEVDVL